MGKQQKNKYKKGAYIYLEKDEDIDNVYIIENGEIAFESSNKYLKKYKMIAKAGDLIGFISSLSNRPRIESAYSLKESTLIELSKSEFLNLLHKNSEIAIKIINYFADELRTYDNMMFSQEKSGKLLPIKVKLFNLGNYYFNENIFDFAYYILNRFLQLYPDTDLTKNARDIIYKIESTGTRKIDEPIKNGLNYKYVDKQIIFCENEPGDELYIIKKGKVKIVKFHNNNEIMLSVLKEGDIFGELAIVSDTPRNATAISYGSTELLPITKESLIKLMSISQDILKRIFTSISKRVWFTYIRLESTLHKKPITRIYAFLEDKLMEDNISLKSKEPHTFNFGINELLQMTDLTQDILGSSLDKILQDQNLIFNFGQTIVMEPRDISSRARFYRSRDNIADVNHKKT